jgi:hypothetical protein
MRETVAHASRSLPAVGRDERVAGARTHVALAAIVVLALALRLAWLGVTDTEPPVLSDPQYYHATAQNVAEGRGYSVRLDERGFVAGDGSEATAFWAPGYSFAIASAYKPFGADVRWAKALNALAGALTVVPAFILGRRLSSAPSSAGTSSDGAGLVAALLFALTPSLAFWTPALFSEPVFTLGVAATLALAVRAGDAPSPLRSALVGLAFAATVFVRSQAVVLIVPLMVLMVRQRSVTHAARAMAPVVAVLMLFVIPWAIRNEMAMGRPYLVSSNVCYNLRGAHAPYSTGTSVPIQDLWDERPGISFHERELLFDGLGCERAWEYARTHFGRELELATKRIGWLLRSDAAAAMRWSESLGATPIDVRGRDALVLLGDVYWYALLGLAGASMFVLPRNRMTFALWTTLAIWLAMHLVFHGEPRYHIPMVPVLTALAAASLVRAAQTGTPLSDCRRGVGREVEPHAPNP